MFREREREMLIVSILSSTVARFFFYVYRAHARAKKQAPASGKCGEEKALAREFSYLINTHV